MKAILRSYTDIKGGFYDRVVDVPETHGFADVGNDRDLPFCVSPNQCVLPISCVSLEELNRLDAEDLISFTPEPWRALKDGISCHGDARSTVLEHDGYEFIAVCESAEDKSENIRRAYANAERIVECVNGCSGIRYPGKAVPKLIALVRAFLSANEETADTARYIRLDRASQEARCMLKNLECGK